VRTLLEEIIDTISSRAIERGLELNYTIDANVPSSVKGDPFRLRQILLNLMVCPFLRPLKRVTDRVVGEFGKVYGARRSLYSVLGPNC